MVIIPPPESKHVHDEMLLGQSEDVGRRVLEVHMGAFLRESMICAEMSDGLGTFTLLFLPQSLQISGSLLQPEGDQINFSV